MNRKSLAIIFALMTSLLMSAATTIAQAKTATQQPKTAAAPAVTTLRLLPPSDAVAFVNVSRLINDAVPKALADSPSKLAEFNADLDKFKAQTGIDARSFSEMAIGMLYRHPRPEITTTDLVAIARGTFDSNLLIAAARLATKGKYREEKHGASTIYIFTVGDHVKLLGLMNMRVGEVAVASLDSNALVMGELPSVRATVDSAKTPGRANAQLIQMATRTPAAVISFGANIPPSVTSTAQFDNPEMSKIVAAIRHAYGAISTTENGFEIVSIAQTEKPEQAQVLSQTLVTLKQIGGMFVAQLPPATRPFAQKALDSLTISATGNETSIKLQIAQADISTLMRFLQPKIAHAR